MDQYVVYLHGVGGPTKRDAWLSPLEQGLVGVGSSRISASDVRIVDPEYASVLRQLSDAGVPRLARRTPDADARTQQMLEYAVRQSQLERLVRKHAGESPQGLGKAPRVVGDVASPYLARVMREAHLYRADASTRAQVVSHVISQLPTAGRLVVVAHSLGSVVAIDLLALQRPNWSHSVSGYTSLPLVAAVEGDTLFGESRPAEATRHDTPSRRMDPAWDLPLLAFAFSDQLSRTCSTKKREWRMRLDAARRISAQRFCDEITEHRDALPDGISVSAPVPDDLVHRPSDLIRDAWSDEELVPYAVSLMMSPAVPPFVAEADTDHRELALADTLNRVRRRSGARSDREYAHTVRVSLDRAQDVTGGRSFPWGAVLGAGAVVLAATGVGLALAVPAGLAGAAMITSTLAAFGPGGMVGGMVTLATATGVGSGLLGASAARTVNRRDATDRIAEFSASIANSPQPELTSVLTGVIATSLASHRLEHGTAAGEQGRSLTAQALAVASNEHALAAKLAPGADTTKQWQKKVQLLERVLEWFDSTFPTEEDAATSPRTQVRAAIEDPSPSPKQQPFERVRTIRALRSKEGSGTSDAPEP